jgi:hypothetical protein
VSIKYMTSKQLQVYGARIRLAWFRKSEELGTVKAAGDFLGSPGVTTIIGISVGAKREKLS